MKKVKNNNALATTKYKIAKITPDVFSDQLAHNLIGNVNCDLPLFQPNLNPAVESTDRNSIFLQSF